MDFNSIGNMNLHLRTMELKSMWSMRKKNQDYTSKGQQRLDQMFESMYGANADEKEKAQQRLSEIMQKYYNGGKLTSEEKEFLRTRNPQAYNEIVQEEQEQKAFEKELERCETKEDVERLKMNHINGALAGISKVENNPNIPKAAKLAAFARAKRYVDNVVKSTQKFIESGAYSKLPTDAEKALAEKKELEREKQQLEAVQETAKETTEAVVKEPEQAETVEKTDERTEETKPVKTQETTETDIIKPDSVLPESERYVESAEERKVRRAKAKAAYAGASSFDFRPQNMIDKKA